MRFYFAYTALVTVIMTASAAASASSSSSSSGLDEIDPPQTRKTRSLWAKNADSCRTQNDMIVALKEEIENLQSSPNDGGGYDDVDYGRSSCTDPGDDAYSTGNFQSCCDNRDWELKPCGTDDSCYYCPEEAEPILLPFDHSTTVANLTESYFLNDYFWFTVPGGKMMQTFKDVPHGDAYDNAMAVQFLIRQDSTVARGKDILNAFAHHMYCDSQNDGWQAAKKTTASGERVQLFRQWFVANSAHQTTPEGYWANPYAVGNNVYVGLAFAHASTVLAKQTPKHAACYALAAYDIADALLDTRKCPNGDYPRDNDWGVNTESMADWKGLLNTLNQHGDYDKQVAGTDVLFEKAYNEKDPSYYAGMTCKLSGTDSGFGNGAHPADTTYWSAMADAALKTGTGEYSDNMINAMRNVYNMVNVDNEHSNSPEYQGQGFNYNGFKFSDKATYIQWEVTASAGVMSMMHSLDKHAKQMKDEGLDKIFKPRMTAYLKSIIHLIKHTGSVPGSVHIPGSRQFDRQTWVYPHKPHLAASAWSGMALLMYGASASDKNAFNVFAAQKDMMSRKEAKDTCSNIIQTLANSCKN